MCWCQTVATAKEERKVTKTNTECHSFLSLLSSQTTLKKKKKTNMDNCVSAAGSHMLFVCERALQQCHVLTWQMLFCLRCEDFSNVVCRMRTHPWCLVCQLESMCELKDVAHWQWSAPGCRILWTTLKLSTLHSHGCRDPETLCVSAQMGEFEGAINESVTSIRPTEKKNTLYILCKYTPKDLQCIETATLSPTE